MKTSHEEFMAFKVDMATRPDTVFDRPNRNKRASNRAIRATRADRALQRANRENRD